MILIEARRRAGLSQRALAERAGLAQQEIARYERGRVRPSLERLRDLVAACSLELTFGLARADDSYDSAIATALMLSPARRLRRALADAQPLRAAQAQATGALAATPPDVLGTLRALANADVEYVLVGELAEAIHGSPLLTLSSVVRIVPRSGQRERLSAAIAACGGRPTVSTAPIQIDAPAGFSLQRHGVEIVLEPAPAGTHGYDDLRRDARPTELEPRLTVVVASLLDLVRIADASPDSGRLPALRRTLRLASNHPIARAA
jgi:transcriptional regulator with XRE-family HTH domain